MKQGAESAHRDIREERSTDCKTFLSRLRSLKPAELGRKGSVSGVRFPGGFRYKARVGYKSIQAGWYREF